MIIDTHCHLDLILDFNKFKSKNTLKQLCIMAVTTTPKAYEKEIELFKSNDRIMVALGLHPQLIKDRAHEVEILEKHLVSATYVGEVGLDFSRQYYPTKESQIMVFKRIIDLCGIQGGKIISLHTLKSEKYVLDILEEYNCTDNNICILHWYTGTIIQLKRAINMGCYFSVNERMLKSEKGRQIISLLPSDRILLESDMPFVVDACEPDTLYNRLNHLVSELGKINIGCTYEKIEANSRNIFKYDYDYI